MKHFIEIAVPDADPFILDLGFVIGASLMVGEKDELETVVIGLKNDESIKVEHENARKIYNALKQQLNVETLVLE